MNAAPPHNANFPHHGGMIPQLEERARRTEWNPSRDTFIKLLGCTGAFLGGAALTLQAGTDAFGVSKCNEPNQPTCKDAKLGVAAFALGMGAALAGIAGAILTCGPKKFCCCFLVRNGVQGAQGVQLGAARQQHQPLQPLPEPPPTRV